MICHKYTIACFPYYRTSLLSFSSSTADDDPPQWTPGRYRDPPQWTTPASHRLGKFVRSESNLATHALSTSCEQKESNSLREHTTSTDTQSRDNRQTSNKEQTPNKQAEGVKTVISVGGQPSNKWEAALARYRSIRKSPGQTASKETLNEHSQSLVEARAERFGGTKGSGLRRAQSFQIGTTRTTPVTKKPVLH